MPHFLRSLRVSAIALFAAACTAALAQGSTQGTYQEPPAPPLPIEFSEDARRAYAEGLNEARALVEARRYDEALAKLDVLTQLRPREAQARFMKGVAQADAGRASDAIGTLRALSADFPELPEPRNNLAVLYAARGDHALARDELLLAIAAAPDYAIAHENLGDVYLGLAAAAYERAATLDKANRNAAQKLKAARDLLVATAP